MENIKNLFLNNPSYIYVCIALIFSFFYGYFSERIFWNERQRTQAKKDFGRFGSIHQFWLNFVGSVTGWFLLYLFISVLRNIGVENITFVHIVLFIFAIIGIIGWLPLTLMGIITSLADIAKKILNKIVSA